MPMRTFSIIVLILTSTALATPQDLATKVKKILSSKNQKVAFSLRDSNGQEIIEYRGQTSLTPASIAKTVTTACSLEQLGPQFQFETNFGYTGKIQGDTLNGDLIIQGHGDPSIIIEDLREIVEKLRYLHGLKTITGNLVFDLSYLGKKSLPMSEGFEGDSGRSFTADITPASFNQNSFSIWVAPDVREANKTRAISLPAQVVDVEITNKAKIASSTEVNVNYDPGKMKATVFGTLAADAEPKGLYRSVDDPYNYAFKLLQRLWNDAGGKWTGGEVKFQNGPLTFKSLWLHRSRPLGKIMTDVNKLSLNLGAEMIFLAAGSEKNGRPATYDKSLQLLKECLKKFETPEDSIQLTNGSGLSREARIQVSGLSLFLNKYLQSPYSPEYLSSFGISGVDGTARTRLKNQLGRARLKTGSLKDVRSVAGYLYSKDHRFYSFAMIQNSVNSSEAKALEDLILETILNDI